MKWLFFVIFLVACAPVLNEKVDKPKEVIEEVIDEPEEVVEELDEVVEEAPEEVIEEPEEVVEEEPEIHSIAELEYEGHDIKIISVSEMSDSCFVDVDGKLFLLEEGEPREIDDITINVTRAEAFRGSSKDICEIEFS